MSVKYEKNTPNTTKYSPKTGKLTQESWQRLAAKLDKRDKNHSNGENKPKITLKSPKMRKLTPQNCELREKKMKTDFENPLHIPITHTWKNR